MIKFIFYISISLPLIALNLRNSECIIDGKQAPKWVCYDFDNNIIQAVGISSHRNLNLRIKKKLAIANAKANLAGIIKSRVESNILIKTKINNEKYSKEILSQKRITTFEKISNYQIKDFWIHPTTKDVYVLVSMKKYNKQEKE
jgi:hypothetical protein